MSDHVTHLVDRDGNRSCGYAGDLWDVTTDYHRTDCKACLVSAIEVWAGKVLQASIVLRNLL